MRATITTAQAEDMLAEDGYALDDVYATLATYIAEHGIDTDVPIDTPVLTADDVAAMRARLAKAATDAVETFAPKA